MEDGMEERHPREGRHVVSGEHHNNSKQTHTLDQVRSDDERTRSLA